ncbi:MAG: hypothetical protein IJV98_04125 [Clostridia bacterium]|nr:hypothetical protein [Clostridia bacterium]
MKKILIVLLAGAMMFLQTACGATPPIWDPITYETKPRESTSENTQGTYSFSEMTTKQTDTSLEITSSSLTETTNPLYFTEIEEPTVKAYAEVISEHKTIKVTFVSDHPLSVYLNDNAYIKGYQGEYIDKGYLNYPMESPLVCYIPIGYFYAIHGEFKVTKYASVEPMRYFYETVKVEANMEEAFSAESITVSDPFLDAALKAEFGGTYSERDLSQISSVQIYYYRTTQGEFPSEPSITLTYYDKRLGAYDNATSVYRYSDFFDEDWTGAFPEETLLDMQCFPLLQLVEFRQSRSKTTPSEVSFPEGYLDRILVKEYTADDFSE